MTSEQWLDMIENGPKPILLASIEENIKAYGRRKIFIEKYSWAVPSYDAITTIANFVKDDVILEIGSGSGLWASLLRAEGTHIYPTDKQESCWQHEHGKFCHVERLTASQAIKKYNEDCNALMMVWPPYNKRMAYYALSAFKGNKVIYIGEGYGGCTGCDKFHQLLAKEWELKQEVNIPQWYDIHDGVYLYDRIL